MAHGVEQLICRFGADGLATESRAYPNQPASNLLQLSLSFLGSNLDPL